MLFNRFWRTVYNYNCYRSCSRMKSFILCDIQKFSFIILSFLNKNQIRYFYIRIQDYFISPLFSISFSIYINIIVLTSTFPISTAVSDFDRTPLIYFRIIIDIDSLSNIRYLSLFVYILYS